MTCAPVGVSQQSLQALQHVATAQESLSTGDLEIAQSNMEQALALAPRDPNVLTAFGIMLADVGNPEKAIVTLQQAVRIEPSTGFEKYMCEIKKTWVCDCVHRLPMPFLAGNHDHRIQVLRTTFRVHPRGGRSVFDRD